MLEVPADDEGEGRMDEVKPLEGFTVGVTAARRAEEFGALLERRGATVQHAPALRIVPLADDAELLAGTERLVAESPDVAVATTAVGFRGWLEAADGWGLGDALRRRLAGAQILARGPKVRGAVRAAGLREAWSPASESLAEVRERLLAEGVRGQRIAVQLHGEPLQGFVTALRAAGAEVVGVPVYRWLPPEDPRPLDRLIEAVLAGDVDALPFTSAPAVTSLLRRADEQGAREALLETLRGDRVLVACVGPVTAAPLEAAGVPTAGPQRFRLGPLVHLLCRRLPEAAPEFEADGHRVAVRGHAVVVDGRLRPVPRNGMALLRELARRPGQVVPRACLLRALPRGGPDEDVVDAATTALRSALGIDVVRPSVAEQGYRLAAGPVPR